MSDKPAAKAADGKDAKGGKSKLMAIVAGVVLLAGAGGGYFWYSKKQAAEAEAAAAEHGEDEEDEAEAEADHKSAKNEHGDAKKKKKKKKKAAEGEHARLMSFEPFVVNLADPGAARFLRTNIQLVVTGGEEGGGGHGGAKGPTVEEMRARSAILELLSAETSEALTTPEGKDALKEQITERMEDVLGDAEIEVEDVLFSDFVIQF